MEEVHLYLNGLMGEEKFSHSEAEIFLDYAYDLALNGEAHNEIELSVKEAVGKYLNDKKSK